jgi:hypothetical protein
MSVTDTYSGDTQQFSRKTRIDEHIKDLSAPAPEARVALRL